MNHHEMMSGEPMITSSIICSRPKRSTILGFRSAVIRDMEFSAAPPEKVRTSGIVDHDATADRSCAFWTSPGIGRAILRDRHRTLYP